LHEGAFARSMMTSPSSAAGGCCACSSEAERRISQGPRLAQSTPLIAVLSSWRKFTITDRSR
jgi:hypothetical protein